MQCNHCGKIVPNTNKICSFCGQEIDPNGHYIDPTEDLGSIDKTDYDGKFDLKVVNDYIKDPNHKKVVILSSLFVAVILIVFVFIIIAALSSGGGNTKNSKSYFLAVSDNIYDYIEENIFVKKGHTGDATVKFEMNDNNVVYAKGDYVFDLLKNYYSFSGTMDGNYSDEDIKLESSILNYDIKLDKNILYLKSDIYENPLSSDLSSISPYLDFSNYDMKKVVTNLHDILDETLDTMSYTSGSEEINFRGTAVNTNTATLKLDGEGMAEFVDTFIDGVLENSTILNEYASINDIDKDAAKTYFTDLKKSLEYKFKSSKDVLTITIYYTSSQMYRIVAEYVSDNTYTYQLDLATNKYYFDYTVNSTNVISASLSHVVKEMTSVNRGEIKITFDTDSYITNTTIIYNDDLSPSYTKTKIENDVAINSLTETDFATIAANLQTYTNYSELLAKYRNLFLSDCSADLTCNCSETTCLCEKDGNMITCPISLIK